ncbi:MAG TPA: LD-carboxypeptidase [Bacteroidia bacterium]|nr:LD-carboxypeptidase [Bacteroidia bacterium]
MNKISHLKQNDKIAIVATARKISEAELAFAVETFKSWGLQPVLGKNIYATENQFAGSDKQRAADLQWAINDDSIKAIIIARGGYGTVRIVDAVNFTKLKTNPKFMIGYSDVTVLHSHIHTHIGIPTLHATMPINFDKNAEATETLRQCLFGENKEYQFEANPLNKEGEAMGVLVGGNLSLLSALSGTASDIDTKGKILFLEDLDEYLYHIDRMMLNLKRSEKLAELKGLVIGGFTDMKDNVVPFGKTAEEIILDAVKEYNYPVCFNFPAGHIDRNLALYFGRQINLKVNSNNCTLTY